MSKIVSALEETLAIARGEASPSAVHFSIGKKEKIKVILEDNSVSMTSSSEHVEMSFKEFDMLVSLPKKELKSIHEMYEKYFSVTPT